jgi:putative membrane protein
MLALVNEEHPGDPEGAERRTALADERTSLASERTSLAGERTLLAWWRTGLTAIAVALAVGRFLPELTPHSTRWPYAALGIAFALYGIAMFLLGTRRLGYFEGGEFEGSAEDRMLLAFMGGGVILGIGTLVLIAAQ